MQPDFPEGCFLFNEPEDIQGWSIEAIGDNCPASLSHNHASFPFSTIDDTGRIGVGSLSALNAITPQCDVDSSGWRFFVNSPLIDDPNWQNIQGVRFRLASMSQYESPIQARLTAWLTDGSAHFERDSQGEYIMHDLTGVDWHTVDLDLSEASSRSVTRLSFIFAGSQAMVNSAGPILHPTIDAVCPIR